MKTDVKNWHLLHVPEVLRDPSATGLSVAASSVIQFKSGRHPYYLERFLVTVKVLAASIEPKCASLLIRCVDLCHLIFVFWSGWSVLLWCLRLGRGSEA